MLSVRIVAIAAARGVLRTCECPPPHTLPCCSRLIHVFSIAKILPPSLMPDPAVVKSLNEKLAAY